MSNELLDAIACDRCKRSIREIPSLELESWAVVAATFRLSDQHWYGDEFDPDEHGEPVPRRWTCRCWDGDWSEDRPVPLNDAGQQAMDVLTGIKRHPAARYYSVMEMTDAAV
jgi:hypothetical protein